MALAAASAKSADNTNLGLYLGRQQERYTSDIHQVQLFDNHQVHKKGPETARNLVRLEE